MKKLLPYMVIGGLIVLAILIVSGQNRKEITNSLDNQNSVNQAIEAELEQLDEELEEMMDSDFDSLELIDDQLSL